MYRDFYGCRKLQKMARKRSLAEEIRIPLKTLQIVKGHQKKIEISINPQKMETKLLVMITILEMGEH